jgi:hypothetical protein
MNLIKDVVSNFKGFVYAKAGTEVILISQTLHVSIVEDVLTKERFSCATDNLTENELKIVEVITEVQQAIKFSKPVSKAKQKQPVQQNTLF